MPKRFVAIFLCCHPKGYKMSFASAAKYMHISKEFVKKWVKHLEEIKIIDDLPDRDLKQNTASREDKAIIQLHKENSILSLGKAQNLLLKNNVNISIIIIKGRLEEEDISWCSTKRKHLLFPKHVEKRLAQTRENIDRD
ncbi:hypothetical protein WH47_06641 [Habropoda laboriosa]|uniref:Uncharacterized protein n=1 Tax=Habropoda laboriosa TaxID=597456 RepID=A0A0L7QRI7_9HYME|nr:hypothetical protein WH47_06641 [Habropoda laboriosa]